MFSKQHKLTRKDFPGGLFVGSKLHTNTLTLIYNQNKDKFIKLGFLISKKISKKAVVRNHLKRSLYGFLEKKQILNLPYSVLVVIKPKKFTNQLLETITSDLKNSLGKLPKKP